MTAGADKKAVRSRGRFGRLASSVTGRVAETIDPDAVIEHIDIDQVVDRIDANRLLDRIDVDRLLERVDVNRLLDRVDVNRLVARLDIDAALDSVDLEAVLRRAGIPEMVAESTGHMAGSALDLGRRQLAGLDAVFHRLVIRSLRRDPAAEPVGPPRLADSPS